MIVSYNVRKQPACWIINDFGRCGLRDAYKPKRVAQARQETVELGELPAVAGDDDGLSLTKALSRGQDDGFFISRAYADEEAPLSPQAKALSQAFNVAKPRLGDQVVVGFAEKLKLSRQLIQRLEKHRGVTLTEPERRDILARVQFVRREQLTASGMKTSYAVLPVDVRISELDPAKLMAKHGEKRGAGFQPLQEYTTLQWLNLAKRSFTGEHSPEILAWQQHNRHTNPKAAVFSDHIAQNARPVETAKVTATGIKDGAIAAGTFIGEEAARFRLGQQTVTGRAFKISGTFIGEEVARLRLGQPTTTGNFVRFIGEEAARLRLGEQTYMGPVIRQHLHTFADTPTTKLMHEFASSATQSMVLWEFGIGGARAVIKAAPPMARFTVSSAKKAATVAQEFVATHEFQSPITLQFESSSKAVTLSMGGCGDIADVIGSIKFRKPLYHTQTEFLKTKVGAIAGREHQMVISQGTHGYENFNLARVQAREFIHLGDDAVPMLSIMGPHEQNVFVGMISQDGKSYWRLDWDRNKGMHINWKYEFGRGKKDFYAGSIMIDNATQDTYWELINRFPRNLSAIGGPK